MTDTHSIQLVRADIRILNAKSLAAELEVSRSTVLAMTRAGYKFTHGRRTTRESAVAWMAAFPDFRALNYLRRGWEKLPKLLANRQEPVSVNKQK